jgi:iron(III) transport system ATP-binding protein
VISGVSIDVEAATKCFGAATVLDKVSFSIEPGSFTTLLGPSGCGKTTILRALAGLAPLDGGTIRIAGVDVTPLPTQARNAILVFQDYALFPHLTVAQNVAYGLKLRKENRQTIDEKLDKTLKYLGIAALGDRRVTQLSGGQQQRVALARALVMEPQVLLLDEPLSNLDAQLRVGIRAELRRIQRDLGITTVYVTHDQAEALALSDRIVVMNHGRVAQIGTPREVYFHPSDEFVAGFVGTANVLTGVVASVQQDRVEVNTPDLAFEVRGVTPLTGIGESWRLCLRPESLLLSESGKGMVSGTIAQVLFEGTHTRYEVVVGSTRLWIDDFDPRSERLLGSLVGVGIDSTRVHVISRQGV